MAHLRKLPSGSWKAVIYVGTVGGKKKYEYITKATRQECKAAAAILEAELAEGKYKSSSNITVGEAMTDYINGIATTLSPTTLGTYRGYARKSFAALSGIPIKKITAETIQLHYATSLKDLAPKSIANANGFLNLVLTKYLGNKSPCKDVRLPKKVKYISVTLSDNEIATLLKGIEGHVLEAPILLALWCGLRRGEVLGLRWQDINYESKCIYIRQTKVYSERAYHIKSPKSYSGTRSVYMPEYVGEILKKLRKRHIEHSGALCNDLVFPKLNAHISRTFKDLLVKLNLPEIRFHDLRHMCATLMMSAGIPDLYTSAALGHGDRDITKIYQHIRDEEKKQAEEKIERFFQHRLPKDCLK